MLSIINKTILSDIDMYIRVFIGNNIPNKKKAEQRKTEECNRKYKEPGVNEHGLCIQKFTVQTGNKETCILLDQKHFWVVI